MMTYSMSGRIFRFNLAPGMSLFALFLAAGLSGQVSYRDNSMIIQNELYEKRIGIQGKGAGPVLMEGLLDAKGTNLLYDPYGVALFEFVVDHHPITSLDPVWRYAGFETRAMGNGGTEIILIIQGVKDPVKGLNVLLFQQTFPGTTLMREMIILQPAGERQFTLNKLQGKLHFRFPQYAIASGRIEASTEIRLASWAGELIEVDETASSDERFPGGTFSDHNLAYNHMYHPKMISHRIKDGENMVNKGPIQVLNTGEFQWISAYEHASQDDLRGLYRNEMVEDGDIILDASQGTQGVFNFPVSFGDFHFLGIRHERQKESARIAIEAIRGAYLDGEVLNARHPYHSVWTATAFDRDTSARRYREILHDYMWRCICEKPASRHPEFYYNTWGMQRRLNSMGYDLRGVLTEQKIREEIRRAAELEVNIFVLDDGWEEAMGIWKPHPDRLPDGLAPIKKELDKYGIKMGIWLSPMGIDSTTQRYRDHPEWVIKDSEGNPVGAQWGHPAFDFVSDFYHLFIEDCKELIDAGARFFKWDAINTFYSTLPGLHHGSDRYPDEEIRARYEYLLPVYVTRAMKELTDYEPELVIEVDLTEASRVMIGLAPMSQGKLFWMNNGASGYNDYSSYRAKSMRTIPNRYAGIIPLELFTYANYPQSAGKSMRYNLNTSLVAGHGFWGALEETTLEERIYIGRQVLKSKTALPYVADILPEVTGRVGSSPEIYTQVNPSAGAGQVIAFSGSAMEYRHAVALDPSRVLAVLNHAYSFVDNELVLDLDFPMPDATREAFIIPNQGGNLSIFESTGWLNSVLWQDHQLIYSTGVPGSQKIRWDKALGRPVLPTGEDLEIEIAENSNAFLITITVEKANREVMLKAEK